MIKIWIKHKLFEIGMDSFFSQIINSFKKPNLNNNDLIISQLKECYQNNIAIKYITDDTHIYYSSIIKYLYSDNYLMIKSKIRNNLNTGSINTDAMTIINVSEIYNITW